MNNSSKQNDYCIAKKVSVVTLIVNAILAAFKLFAGFFANSAAMLSDAVHSASDVLSTVVVLIGLKISSAEADEGHQYGHERFEAVAAFILSSMLFATALAIGGSGLRSVKSALAGNIEAPGGLALVAAFISIVVKEWMYWYTRAAAKKINSGALMADAWHHRSDSLSSIGAVIGIGGAMLGFPVLDPIASLVICLLIAHASYEIAKDAINKLTDRAADAEVIDEITKNALDNSRVKKIDHLKTRIYANKLYVDIEIAVDRNISLLEAHEIAEEVHNKIEIEVPLVKHCMVHVNPEDIIWEDIEMFILPWNDKYLTGIELIDNQHKELFLLLNLYAVECQTNMNFEKTMKLLTNLTDYTMRHFQAEEAFMKSSGYPKFEEHQAHHSNMKFDVKRYVTLFDNSDADKVQIFREISKFISDWLLSHIDIEDRNFAEYYREKIQ